MGSDWNKLYQGTFCLGTTRFVFDGMFRYLHRFNKDGTGYDIHASLFSILGYALLLGLMSLRVEQLQKVL